METTPGARAGDADTILRRPFGLISDQLEMLDLARRLAGSGRRVVHYILPPKRSSETSPYLEAAATAVDVAMGADIIAIAIDDTKTMREVLLGTADRAGVALDLAPGATLIDFGIRSPRDSQAILGILGMRGISVVDAAVIGGAEALARGTASVLAGGFPDAVEAAMPLLGELGTVERTGPLGSAQTAAALMGYVEAAHISARSEALIMGRALGLKDPTLTQILGNAEPEQKIVRFTRSAELVRALTQERGDAADIIDLTASLRAPTRGEIG